MVDSIRITSAAPSHKVSDTPVKPIAGDAIFDILNPDLKIKIDDKAENTTKEGFKETLMQNLQKEIIKPLLSKTTLESETLRKLVLMSKLFESSTAAIPKELLDGIFLDTQELLSELLLRDKTETLFKGSFFDSLRGLAKLDGYPQLKDAIVSVLRHFDAYVNRDQSFKALLNESLRLMGTLSSDQRAGLEHLLSRLSLLLTSQTGGQAANDQNLMARLENLIKGVSPLNLNGDELSGQLDRLLKDEMVPTLGNLMRAASTSEKQYQSILSILNQIVRYDKGEASQLDSAMMRLATALKPLSNLSDQEILDMKNQIFSHAREAEILFSRLSTSRRPGLAGDAMTDKLELSQLLEKALDPETASKLQVTAQSLLETLVRSESPVFPIMHFLIPFRFMDNDTYGEFYIDKDPSDKDTGTGSSTDIFFSIQSDRYGDFEVFMKVRETRINMEIKCPVPLINVLNSNQGKIRSIIEEQGYRLFDYAVDEFTESQSILKRFPKLALRKVGLDVTI